MSFRTLMMLGLLLAGRASQGPCQTPPSTKSQTPSASIKAQQQELRRLTEEGERAYNNAEFATAEKAYLAALKITEAIQRPKAQAFCLNALGTIYLAMGEPDRARDYALRALPIWEATQERGSLALTLNLLGGIAVARGELDKALDYHKRSHALYETLNNPSDLAMSFRNLGAVYNALKQTDKALECCQQALKLRETQKETLEMARVQMDIGNLYADRGELDKALDYLDRAQAVFQTQGNPLDRASNLTAQGNVYKSLDQLDKALDRYLQAQALAETLGIKRNLALTLTNSGAVYMLLQQRDKAQECFNRALALLPTVENYAYRVRLLNTVAVFYFQQGRYAQARDLFERALNAAEGQPRNEEVAGSLVGMGMCYRNTREYEKAADCFLRARPLYEALNNRRSTAIVVMNLGECYSWMARFEAAERTLQQALTLFEALNLPHGIAECLDGLGIIYFLNGDFARAEKALNRALPLYESVADQLTDPSGTGDFQETLSHFYARHAFFLLQRGRVTEALERVERGRGQGLARQAARSRADLTRFLKPEDAARLQAYRRENNLALNQMRAMQSQRPPVEGTALQTFQKQFQEVALRSRLAAYNLNGFWQRLMKNYPQYSLLQGARPPGIAALTELARRHPDTLYVEWAIVHTDFTLLFALSHRDGLRAFKLHTGDDRLTQQVEAWREAMLGRLPTEPQRARSLYATLLGPLEKAGLLAESRHSKRKKGDPGRCTRLVLVPDGPLLNLPFTALMDGGGRRLIERFAVSTAISLGVLTWPASRSAPSETLLCAADPQGENEGRIADARRKGFGALPFARQEGNAVAALVPRAIRLFGKAAREADVKRLMPRCAILHFATHGLLDPVNGLRSGLLLAPEPTGSQEDGILEAREIAERRLAARLAVLSGCETGQGAQGGGEGLIGLAWAFRAAGCPAVVASLWQVDDVATERLMVTFYKELKTNRRKDEALRQAMLRVKRQKGDPYFWAAFQLIGDTAPLSSLQMSRR